MMHNVDVLIKLLGYSLRGGALRDDTKSSRLRKAVLLSCFT